MTEDCSLRCVLALVNQLTTAECNERLKFSPPQDFGCWLRFGTANFTRCVEGLGF